MKGVVFLGVLLPLLACAAQQQPSSEWKASVDVKGETTAASGFSAGACPCSGPRLCEPVSAGPRKEVLGFVTSQLNWARYNWSEVTTLAMFTGYNSSLMCYAHSMVCMMRCFVYIKGGATTPPPPPPPPHPSLASFRL